ncbi:MAG TPA: ion channel, partial [Caulobacteraceae bacterium]|nr:ion channel [Caulobacteraceae bacterium]
MPPSLTSPSADAAPPPLARLGGSGRSTRFKGLPAIDWRDGYHALLTMPLAVFFAVMAAAFLGVNVLFACLYLADPDGLAGARPGSFADAFFFSVQTLGTIGYGAIAPRSLYANLVVTLESFVGLFQLAIATGLMFARVSRPTARIMFSDRAVVGSHDGAPTFMFRAANRRRNRIVEAEVSLSLVTNVILPEGGTMRMIRDLPVLRSRSPLFVLTWQVMHKVDEASPLWGQTAESLAAAGAEILVVM